MDHTSALNPHQVFRAGHQIGVFSSKMVPRLFVTPLAHLGWPNEKYYFHPNFSRILTGILQNFTKINWGCHFFTMGFEDA